MPSPKVPPHLRKKLGRKTTYRHEVCEKIVNLGREGKSLEQISCELNIPYHTFLTWADVQPDLKQALQTAKDFEMKWWEDKAMNHLVELPGGAKINTGLWSRSMAARFPKKYRDNSRVEVTGRNGTPVEVEVVHNFAQSLMDDLLAARQADADSDDN